MKENNFQSQLIKELKLRFPGCIVLKNDANFLQGIPDLLVLQKDKWAMLECKTGDKTLKRPNQKYYIKQLDDMGYARFIDPTNKETILNEMEFIFRS